MEASMKQLLLTSCFAFAVAALPAHAQTRGHTMGNNFTKALNAMTSCGALSTLAPTKQIQIASMTTREGKIFVALQDQQSSPIVYDLASSRVETPGICP
jgi:hypothetical protein